MKYSTKVSDAVHILSFIALNAKESLTSQAIAESVKTNPAFVRQMMSSLRNAGLLTSVKGHAKPALSRDAKDISLLDVYRAVEGDKPLLHQDTHTNPECGVGVNIQLVICDCYDQVQKKAEEEMAPSACRISWTSTKNGWKAGTLISGARCRGLPAFPSVWQNRIMKVIVLQDLMHICLFQSGVSYMRKLKAIVLAGILSVTCAFSVSAASGYVQIVGNTAYDSNGNSYTTVGNTTYLPRVLPIHRSEIMSMGAMAFHTRPSAIRPSTAMADPIRR